MFSSTLFADVSRFYVLAPFAELEWVNVPQLQHARPSEAASHARSKQRLRQLRFTKAHVQQDDASPQ